MPGGTCFQDALRQAELLAARRLDPILCHGTPIGTGPDNMGRRYWHAWVEVRSGNAGWIVYDKRIFTRPVYYSAGHIVPRLHVVRFTIRQAEEAQRKYEHFGPWVDDWKEDSVL